jgi:hypothetical protein
MRKLIITAAGLAIAVAAVITGASIASASTTDVLTYGSQGGTNVSVNNVLSSELSSGTDATFYTTTTGTSGGSCSTGTMAGTVTSNPAEGGTADTNITSQVFTDCSDNLGFNDLGVTIDTPYTTTTNSDGNGIGTLDATLSGQVGSCDGVCDSPNHHSSVICPGVSTGCGTNIYCYYTGTNVSGTTSWTSQPLALDSGSNADCPSEMYFSATYSYAVDTSVSGDPEVYLNS